MTFRDKEFSINGRKDNSNFMIRGCFFSHCSRYVYLLATRARYKTFLVKYSIKPAQNGVEMVPLSTLEVHNQVATGMRQSRDGSLISVQTSDGYIKAVEESTMKILLSQKRHNLPITACHFITIYGE